MKETSASPAAARSGWSRRKIWAFVVFATLVVVAASIPVYYVVGAKSPGIKQAVDDLKPAGDELKTEQPYGWQTSKDVGTKLTDGLNIITVTPQARGPLRLISAKPLMDDGKAVRVIGILARINPDMLPPGSKIGSFQNAPGFPPTPSYAAGAVPVEGLVVQPPRQGQDRWIELQIGYEFVAPGRSARRGVELVYEYEGARHRVFIPSYVVVCAPATTTCQPEYDK